MRVVVAGALANKPHYGGEAWVRLAWLRGLVRLGVDVRFVERLGVRDPDGTRARFFERVLARHAPGVPATLLSVDGESVVGGPAEALPDHVADADLLVNVSGHLRAGDPAFEAARRRAYVDLDPGFTQIWHSQGLGELGVDRHDVHFTVGWNVGSPACSVPTDEVSWIPLRQPVVLADWPVLPLPSGPRLTTVASWRGAFGPVEYAGRRFGLKVHEFRKVTALPGRAALPLEIALDIHPADARDRTRLVEAGWTLVDPREVAGSPKDFRRYVQGSAGEFSVAQGIYVETRSGWFSDRSARYLASGRPVVVQDTGLAPELPRDEGILAFRTPEDARAAIRAVAEEGSRHATAARQIAEEVFDARIVLAAALDRALDSDTRPSRPTPRPSAAPNASTGTPSTRAASTRPAAIQAAGTRSRTVLVSGMIGSVPGQGGATWAVLQYLLGLQALGYEVHFVEEIQRSELRPTGSRDLSRTHNWRYLREVARRFGLEGRVTLLLRQGGQTAGRPYRELLRLARRAELLVNLSGRLRDPDLLEPIPLRLYLDLDPGFTQLWHAGGEPLGLERHTHFATVGLSLGRPECPIPTCGIEWIPTRPPVVLDHWPVATSEPGRDAWTTVSHWRGYGTVELDGTRLGQKAHSFRPLFPLPGRTRDRFEVALAIHPEERSDLDALRCNGWRLVDPDRVAADPESYRDFVAGSAAELGVAKAGYVQARSGWFSDRSACYLASGRPVLAQDTGFSYHLPVGTGLLTFSDLAGAAEGVARIRADYRRHAVAARAFAERHLASERVLTELLEGVGS